MHEERDRAQEALDVTEGRATHLLLTSRVLSGRTASLQTTLRSCAADRSASTHPVDPVDRGLPTAFEA